MPNPLINKAISCGLITFETLCGAWYKQYLQTGEFGTVDPELLNTVLEIKYEWINQRLDFHENFNFQYENYIGKSPLQQKLNILNFCDLSNISLLGLAIAWKDIKAQETLLKLKTDKQRVAILRYKTMAFVSADDLQEISNFPVDADNKKIFAKKVLEILSKNQSYF